MTPTRRPGLIRSVALAPFELAYGFIAVWAGVSGIFDWTTIARVFNQGLPAWLSTLVNLFYTIAGLAIIGGILHQLRQLEAFGLTVLLSSLIIRAGFLWYAIGITALTNGVILNALIFGTAAAVRLWVLLTSRVITIIEPPRATDVGVNGIVGKVF